MRIGIIDAELIANKKHRFPNLVCMKLSSYHKEKGDTVVLLWDYEYIYQFDKIYISKVFDFTEIPELLLKRPNVIYGGTGFFFDKAPPLPYEIEHCKPDYRLYLPWIEEQLEKGKNIKEYEYYLYHSIGFTTRYCFRGCSNCVNRNHTKVEFHAHVNEFLDPDRKYICLLDDNVLGYPGWQKVLYELQNTGKPFQFKQGLDIRLLTDEKAKVLANSRYYEDFIFAFDNIKERDIIEEKIKLWRRYTNKRTKFYILCGYHGNDMPDIISTLERIYFLAKYNCMPYIMRHSNHLNSKWRGIYTNIAGWANQPNIFKTMTLRDYSIRKGINGCVYKKYRDDPSQYIKDGYRKGASWRYLDEFEKVYPEEVNKYFNILGGG